jgi:ADP-heptose:LPS heptosyltransferase
MSIERTFKRTFLTVLRYLIPAHAGAPPALRDARSILVVRQHNQLGDMLCAVPLLRALRVHCPNAVITLVASPVNYEVMQHHPFVDHLLLYDKRSYLGKFWVKTKRLMAFIRKLRGEGFDLAIVPSTVSTSVTSDLLAYLSGAPTRIGVGNINGVENPSRVFFTVSTRLKWSETPHRHQTLRNMDVVAPLGVVTNNLSTEIGLTAEERRRGREELGPVPGPGGLSIGIHPGAGKPLNRWPASRFASVARNLVEAFNVHIYITCGPMDDDPVRAMTSELSIPYKVIQGKPIRTVASMLSHLDLVLTNDTGIMHVAAAVGAPVLSLFGPTDPQQWAPIGPKHRYIQGREGKIGTITVDEVVWIAAEMLRARGH